METPVFEEFDPASDCDCPGCVHQRRVPPDSGTGRPAAHRALLVVAAASTALGASHAAPALAAPHAPHGPGVPAPDDAGDEPPTTPQGGKAPLHGPSGIPADPATAPKLPKTTRADIIKRAKKWVTAHVPYSMYTYWSDGYRQDCSGFVSMAWNLPGNEWTGSLGHYAVRISKKQLQPGDILLFHNRADPEKGSHVVIFGGWTDYTHTYYIAYEQTPPRTRRQSTPYPYWSHAGKYVPYRYKGVMAGTAGAEAGGSEAAGSAAGGSPAGGSPAGAESKDSVTASFPGAVSFGPAADNEYVTRLGRMLVARGAGSYYAVGPGPRWGEADRRATRAFQLAQGWTGAAADGLPGPQTWRLLVTGEGRDIAAGATGATAVTGTTGATGAPASPGAPVFPGRAMFRPGGDNTHVTQLGRQLVKKGFGKYYTTGPGPRWGEADRRGVEAFQRAQGWRGGAADGYPGPETWRRLFS